MALVDDVDDSGVLIRATSQSTGIAEAPIGTKPVILGADVSQRLLVYQG